MRELVSSSRERMSSYEYDVEPRAMTLSARASKPELAGLAAELPPRMIREYRGLCWPSFS